MATTSCKNQPGVWPTEAANEDAVNLANNTTLFESARAAIKKAIERKNPAYIDNFVAGLEMSLLNFISSQRYHPETE